MISEQASNRVQISENESRFNTKIISAEYDEEKSVLAIAVSFTKDGRRKEGVFVTKDPGYTAAVLLGERSKYMKRHVKTEDAEELKRLDRAYVEKLLKKLREDSNDVEKRFERLYLTYFLKLAGKVARTKLNEIGFADVEAIPMTLFYVPKLIEYPVYGVGIEFIRGCHSF